MSDQEVIRRHRTIWAATALGPWLADCLSSEVPALVNLANSLRRETSIVQRTIDLPVAVGQVDGQITKLNLLKRQSYGRAMQDLLHQRMPHAA